MGWANQLKGLYEAGLKVVERGVSAEARKYAYERLVEGVRGIGLGYSGRAGHPCHAKAQLILRHQDELFQYVIVEGLSSHNNLAERQVRPLVVMRKIMGGSRSEAGSQTTMRLASLFQTWHSQGLNPFEQCLTNLNPSFSNSLPYR